MSVLYKDNVLIYSGLVYLDVTFVYLDWLAFVVASVVLRVVFQHVKRICYRPHPQMTTSLNLV